MPHSPSLGGCERQSSAAFPQKDAHTTTTKVRALRAVVFTLLGKLSNISSGGERFFFCLPPGLWSSWARDQIGCSSTGFSTPCAGPGIEPAAQGSRDTAANPTVPQRELQEEEALL